MEKIADGQPADHIHEPFLNGFKLNDPVKCPPNIDNWVTFKAILNYAKWPILGMLFHPVYSVVNAAVVGRFES